ncbi:MAG TPA: CBASS cGAMP-activated phospholipase [Burkholderiaceae bacterium]
MRSFREGRPGGEAAVQARILALSGGGFLGLFTGRVLQSLEERVGEPLARRFELLAGTSIGGVLALALAFEIPAARIVAVFEEYGQSVFSGRGAPGGPIGRLVDLSRAVGGPKYSGRALRNALLGQFGRATLGESAHAVIVPAVDVARSHAKIFKSPRKDRVERDRRLPVVDVAMAACAAPAYFPSARVGHRLYADGGLFAVAPDQVAMHEAEHFDGVPPDRMRMLSIGTAARHYRPAHPVDPASGAVGWLAEGRLMLTLISAQQQHVAAMMADRLGDRYLRLDADWSPDAGLGVDVATPGARAHLRAQASRALAAAPAQLLEKFLGRPVSPSADRNSATAAA